MAEKRMFAKTIIDSDAFIDMPMSAQCLYFHLCMRADDQGFINNPRKIQRMIGSGNDDLKLLIVKKFIIPFDSGVIVIKHWWIHNYIRGDRVKGTVYSEEMAQLTRKANGAYTLKQDQLSLEEHSQSNDSQISVTCQPNDSQVTAECQHRLDKNRLEENRLDIYATEEMVSTVVEESNQKEKASRIKFSKPTYQELYDYSRSIGYQLDCQRFLDHYESNGWMVGRTGMKDWKAAVRTWLKNERSRNNEGSQRAVEGKQPRTGRDKYGNEIL